MPLLTVLGAINWDVSIFVEKFARPGEEVVVRGVEEFSGGKGANVAVASARILGRNNVCFVGALGNDRIAEMQVEELRKEGVITDFIQFVEGMSGCAYIVVDSRGKKQINTYFGANGRLSAKHLEQKGVRDCILSSDILVIMDVPSEVALTASKMAREGGIRFLYSPGVMVRYGVPFVRNVAESSDYLVLDTVEMLNLYGKVDETESLKNLANDFVSAIVTRGEKGCSLITRGEEIKVPGYNPQEFDGKVVNTTGCGDAFLGVLSSYLVLGYDIIESLKLANLAGAFKATKKETRGSPSKEELEELYSKVEGIRARQHRLQRNRSS